MGETDGEGLEPFFQEGTWSCRTDVTAQDEVPLDSLVLLENDGNYANIHEEDL